MKRKKLVFFLIFLIIAAVILSAAACVHTDNARELKIQFIKESMAIRLQAPWADNISLSVYYGVDENGRDVFSVDGIKGKDVNISIGNYLAKYGDGNYFVVVFAFDGRDNFVKETLSFVINSNMLDDNTGDGDKEEPSDGVKPVEGRLKSVYYHKAKSESDLTIRLYNSSGINSIQSIMDLHDVWTYDSASNLLNIKAAYLKRLSSGTKLPIEITYGDGDVDKVYLQVADSVPMDVVKGRITDAATFSENNNGIIKLSPLIGFDLYLGYDGEESDKQSVYFVDEVVIDGVKLPRSAYSLSTKDAKISFSYLNENILKLSHGYHLFEIYTTFGRSEVWVYLRKGIDHYPQSVRIDSDSSFPNIYVSWNMLRSDAQGYAVHIGDKAYSDKEYPQLFQGNTFDATGKINYLDKVKVSATYDGKTYLSIDDDTLKVDVKSSVIQSYLSYKESFEYLGKKHNYYISDFQEFSDMVQYALMYYTQLSNSSSSKYEKTLRFYIDPRFASSLKEVESNFATALEHTNEAVKETHEIKSVYASVYELNFTVKSTCIPNDDGRDPVKADYKENTFNNYHISPVGRAEGYEGFAVNSYAKTASVKYSEELYRALERGIRPIPQKGSSAEKIYAAAKRVLTRIIDDSMDDYQKVHAMADWLSCRVSYNWSLDKEVNGIPSTSEEYNKFYSYSEFYLEGVFLNNIAVCNGYAKAMSLMCGIEGIECYKIKGGAGKNDDTKSSYPQHAWNKIKIDGKWYVVDTTWANERYSLDEVNTYEVLKHNTLFMTERESGNYSGGAHYEMYKGSYSGYYSGESYDIFANTYFKYGGNMHDMVIDDADELEILLLYMIESKGSNMTKGSFVTIDIRCGSSWLERYLQELREQKSSVFNGYTYTVKYNASYGNMSSIAMKRY